MGSPSTDRPTALVTGANRGLGLETCVQLREKGFRVILTSRDEREGTAAGRKLDSEGKDVLYHKLDVTDRDSISALAKDFPHFAPQLDVLVNNAGIGSWGADRRGPPPTDRQKYFRARRTSHGRLPLIPQRRAHNLVPLAAGAVFPLCP